MASDWIKLYRKMLDSRVMSDPKLCWVFVQCLLRANFRPGYFEGREIKAGQFVFSYRLWAQELKVSPNTLRSVLKSLSRANCIRVENCKKFSLLTVINYESYQSGVSKPDPPSDTRTDTVTDTRADTQTARALNTIEEEQEQQEEQERKKGPIAASGSGRSGGSSGKRQKFDPETAQLPFPSTQFRSAWLDWCEHRRQTRKPLTAKAVEKQFEILTELGEQRAIAAIEHSIAGGYQGIFEPKVRAGPPPPQDFERPKLKSTSELLNDPKYD